MDHHRVGHHRVGHHRVHVLVLYCQDAVQMYLLAYTDDDVRRQVSIYLSPAGKDEIRLLNVVCLDSSC